MYEIHFSNQSRKLIKELDEKRRIQIKKAIDLLREDPFGLPYKKLNGLEADYRIRVGEFRISYSIDKNQLIIRIIKIGNRENFY